MSEPYLVSARESARLRLKQIEVDLAAADEVYGQRCCVYATGSFGRLDAGPGSDLDLFIVVETDGSSAKKPLLNAVDEIKLKNELILSAEKNNVAKFDGGGRFLSSHTKKSFIEWLGSSEDDYRNTLTGRMLMLLESKPLVGGNIYQQTIDMVIGRYFRDFDSHESNFVPAFLFNDIIRMWRTFCVNYEFYRRDGDSRDKVKNLKLKFSRMLTCYSGIIYLLATYAQQGSVNPSNVREMVLLSPTERLQLIANPDFGFDETVGSELAQAAESALTGYSNFLELTHQGTKKAAKLYADEETRWRNESYAFGRSLSTMIDTLGQVSSQADGLRRLILI